MKKIGYLSAVLSLLTATAMTDAAESEWPPLLGKGFIVGRAASEQDVKDGNAIFVAKVGTVIIGKPIPHDNPTVRLLDRQQRQESAGCRRSSRGS